MADHSCVKLRVEYVASPLGLGVRRPRFSWQMDTLVPGAMQTGYELQVTDVSTGEILWSAYEPTSEASTQIEYDGSSLAENASYEWRVRSWASTSGTASDWAGAAFETGFFDSTNWTASWVEPVQVATEIERWSIFDWVTGKKPVGELTDRLRPTQLLRQEFELDTVPTRARLYVTARGIYEAAVNGRRLGDQVLAPGFDSYDHRISVQCYDVTADLRQGTNVIGLTLADGWWAGRIGLTGSSAQWGVTTSATWQLEIDLGEGDHLRVSSEPDKVRSHRGPHDYADLFIGERFDRRLEVSGWDEPGLDASDWLSTSAAEDQSKPLAAFYGEPIRRILEVPAVSVAEDSAAGYIVDFGQVVAGRVRLSLPPLQRGAEISIEHTEVLTPDGEWFINIDGINKQQTDVYVADGRSGGEEYEPAFTFHGFRYVRVRGLAAPPALGNIRAVVISSDTPTVGTFASSDHRLNRLHENVVWSQRANFLSVPTDCPQRERAGWTGDIQVFAAAATNNSQVAAFLTRWLANLRADQLADGRIPIFSPRSPFDDEQAREAVGLGAIVAAAGWSDAIAIVPWTMYERYGDRRVLEENYAALSAWIHYQDETAAAMVPDRLDEITLSAAQRANQSLLYNTGNHFGDWLAPSTLKGRSLHEAIGIAPELTSEVVAPMFQFHTLELAARFADVLDKRGDQDDFENRARLVRDAFIAEYVDDSGLLECDLQGPYVLALAFGLIPAELRAKSAAHLVHLIETNDFRLDTGFLSVPYLLDVLAETGYSKLSNRLLWQSEAPSWLYEVDQGATTIWESWDAIAEDGSARPVSMNHYALGCVDDWLYRRVAGLSPLAPGYKTFSVRPDFDSGLDHASASISTEYGVAEVAWKRTGDTVALEVVVPPNSRAIVTNGESQETLAAGRHSLSVKAA